MGRPDDRYPYILVMTDLFSKYALAAPVKEQSVHTTVQAHYKGITTLYKSLAARSIT